MCSSAGNPQQVTSSSSSLASNQVTSSSASTTAATSASSASASGNIASSSRGGGSEAERGREQPATSRLTESTVRSSSRLREKPKDYWIVQSKRSGDAGNFLYTDAESINILYEMFLDEELMENIEETILPEAIHLAVGGRKVPSNYDEARKMPDWSLWEAAMERENQQFNDGNLWKVIGLPDGKEHLVVGSRYVYALKLSADGTERPIQPEKARIVAQGYSQHPDSITDGTFSPVPSLASVRAYFAVCAHLGFTVEALFSMWMEGVEVVEEAVEAVEDMVVEVEDLLGTFLATRATNVAKLGIMRRIVGLRRMPVGLDAGPARNSVTRNAIASSRPTRPSQTTRKATKVSIFSKICLIMIPTAQMR